MREIKFRAWDKEDKEIFQVIMISWFEGKGMVLSGRGGSIVASDCELMQYTGLKDKNGKEVYEGDVVHRICLDENCNLEHIGVVTYSEKWCFWGIDEKNIQRDLIGGYLAHLVFGSPQEDRIIPIEILGNIYENPELMAS